MRTYRGPAKPLVKTRALMQSFWSKVPAGADGCWEWRGARAPLGYGLLEQAGSPRYAHRVAVFLSGYPLKDSECVLHRCDNPRCVRLSHLFVGTMADNTRDMCIKGRACRKLSPEAVTEIRRRLAVGEKMLAIGRRFGISGTAVAYIRSGRNWKHHIEESL